MGGVEYQVTKVDPTDPHTKGAVHQVHKVSEEIAATLGGKVYRARIINDPTAPTVAGKVYQIVLIGDPSDPAVKGKVYNAILTGGSEAVVIGPAVSPLLLPDAIANSLKYVKAFGGTEQNGTPTPDAPVDIVCNNGVLKARHQSGLPLGYTQLTYIQSDGNQIINTGYVLQETDSVEVDYKLTDLTRTGDKFILGAQPVTGAPGGFWVETYSDTNTWYVRYGSSVSANTYGSVTPTSQLSGTLAISKNSFVVNGVKILTPNFVSMPVTPMTIFNRISLDGSIANFGASAQISEVRVKNGNNLVHRYIPVRNSNNELGMYDLMDSNPATAFHTNAGTGDFIAGDPVSDPVEIYADGTVETIEDSIGNSATCEPLLSIGDYTDVQEILSGAVTRKVGIKVLDGTENWRKTSASSLYCSLTKTDASGFPNAVTTASDVICSHADGTKYDIAGSCSFGANNFNFNYQNSTTDLSSFKQWLAGQYAAGTPVIVIYPLAEPTTESVAGQTLQVAQGDNTLEITQASMSGLELEAEYEKEAE